MLFDGRSSGPPSLGKHIRHGTEVTLVKANKGLTPTQKNQAMAKSSLGPDEISP